VLTPGVGRDRPVPTKLRCRAEISARIYKSSWRIRRRSRHLRNSWPTRGLAGATAASTDMKHVDADFDVYADPTPDNRALAVLVTPNDGTAPYMLPMDIDCAPKLTTTMMRTLVALADPR
jgi:hypothetical protein